MSTIDSGTAAALVDWGAYQNNLQAIKKLVAPAAVMAVIKADGYGHGLVGAADAARAAGAAWLGVAVPQEALTVRKSGDTGRLLCWLYGRDEDLRGVVACDVEVSVSSSAELDHLLATGEAVQKKPRLHLKVDTGLIRNGCPLEQWAQLCQEAAAAHAAERAEVVAVWTHLATAEDPNHPSVAAQLAAFDEAYETACQAGLTPLRHAANSAAALGIPQARFDLVRVGIAGYGVEPAPGVARRAKVKLSPAMTLRAQLISVKQIPAGAGVSYGHTWTAPHDTTIGLIPLGYADGIPRSAGNRGEVTVAGERYPIVGMVCMDQCLVDLGPGAEAGIGDEVIIFGAGGADACEFAAACETIGYEIVTRIGSRVPRVVGDAGEQK